MNITVGLAAAATPTPRARWSATRCNDVSEHMSFLEMLDVLNERLTTAGRGPDRLRQRLPRGHLRPVRRGDQRRGPRPAADHHLPAAHAVVLRRRQDRHRAVAGRPVPGDQGPGRQPRRVRPDHPGRRLHLGADRHRARRARRAGAQERRRPRVRRRHLHRLRRLRRRLPERFGDAVHRRQGHPPRPAARRVSPSGTPGWSTWSAQHDDEGFGGCTNIGECTAVCPKGIPFETISRLNRDLLGALGQRDWLSRIVRGLAAGPATSSAGPPRSASGRAGGADSPLRPPRDAGRRGTRVCR